MALFGGGFPAKEGPLGQQCHSACELEGGGVGGCCLVCLEVLVKSLGLLTLSAEEFTEKINGFFGCSLCLECVFDYMKKSKQSGQKVRLYWEVGHCVCVYPVHTFTQ